MRTSRDDRLQTFLYGWAVGRSELIKRLWIPELYDGYNSDGWGISVDKLPQNGVVIKTKSIEYEELTKKAQIFGNAENMDKWQCQLILSLLNIESLISIHIYEKEGFRNFTIIVDKVTPELLEDIFALYDKYNEEPHIDIGEFLVFGQGEINASQMSGINILKQR